MTKAAAKAKAKSKAKPTAKPRKGSYSQDAFEQVVARMAAGELLVEICADEGMPKPSTIRTWVALDQPPGIAALYARARELQAEAVAERAVDKALTADDPQKGRLAMDALRWLAGKIHPAKFSDKHQLEHSGLNGGPLEFTFVLDHAGRDDGPDENSAG